jgi:hypothetical protein
MFRPPKTAGFGLLMGNQTTFDDLGGLSAASRADAGAFGHASTK